ncbi:membrane peptidoglycan carboxypeptidase [Kitasatospora sp. MAA19]|uniref:transglycosylase domain-containing protein n=1 Tax=Kitasatospora sp. MAA19 TaxID=3035090 RepID=UPI0024769D9B|nr:transglycosylase domain-containing protein [Kitasatospora sp. MAA19]MDH6703652.1 membrane peptidoglycan carboxypeptidase [Kitasatospora sp. MAA19]
MSERRRRTPNPGGDGQQPPGGGDRRGGPGRDELGSAGIGRRRPPGVRETAQQPRMGRAEMRKAAQKGGKGGRRGAAAASAAVAAGPGKKRFIDYPRFGKTGIKRWLPSWRQWLTACLTVFAAFVGLVFYLYQTTVVPQLNDLVKDQNTIYYWADNSEMTRKGETNRQIVELSDISPNLQNAVIAAENQSFRTDSGIDPKGMLRAVYNMAKGGETQGASTITQQYVKNAYLSQEQTLSRKVKEFFITLKINQEKDKNEILKGYLNTSWFGRGANGAQAAAQAYYGVDAKDLNVCQSAMLAGLLKGAAYFDPTKPENKQRANDRWTWILEQMVKTKAITPEERAKCTTFPDPVPQKPSSSMNGEVSYLVDTANKYLMATDKTITQQMIDKGGLKVYTTFEKDKVEALKKAVDDVKGENLNLQKRPDLDKWVQFGSASIRPGDGAIVALYGGDGVENGHFDNNADAIGVQVGSTFKPFVLATAMQVGVQTATDDKGKPKRINADSRYLSDDLSEIRKPDGSLVIGDDGKPYRQKNEDTSKHGYVSLRQAMQYSYNVPFVQLNQDVGGQNVANIAEQMGIKKESFADPKTPTFALGTSTISPIRMATGYGTLAASGKESEPYSVTKVEVDGKERPGFGKKEPRVALEPAVADNVTDVLVNVASNGTGTKTKTLGRPVAGKTGTTDQNKSAWWVGYTPQLVTSVAMWREDPTKHERLSLNGTGGKESIHGGDIPTDIFTRYMKVALANEKKLDFPTPTPVGTEVDSSGAPSTASPTSSPTTTDTPSAPPTTQPTANQPPPAGNNPPQPPVSTQGPGCVPGVDCPASPSQTPTQTNPGPTSSCGFLGCHTPPPTTPPTDTSPSGKPSTKPPTPSSTGGSQGGALLP